LVPQSLGIVFGLLASGDISMSVSVLPLPGGLLVDVVYERVSSGGIRKTSSMK
jgi:hypothetical protein